MTTEAKADAPQPSRARHNRLREIELEIQAKWAAAPQDYQEYDAPADYQNMSWEEKNASKYFATFPYPYMNGYLHLGHAFSMSKTEFQVRYQRQRGRRAILP
jgi:leucyl-tRNA synthetase